MKFSSYTLGCKVNQFETRGIESILLDRGHELVKAGEGCDACIINTCTVTSESAGKSRRAVRRIKRLEPDALIAVCGCLSELEPDTAMSVGADLIGGSGNRTLFALKIERETELRRSAKSTKKPSAPNCQLPTANPPLSPLHPPPSTPNSQLLTANPQPSTLHPQPSTPNCQLSTLNSQLSTFEDLPLASSASSPKTRALLKIQDGCDNRCAYCVIPLARGRSRSLPQHHAAEQAKQLHEQGFREIIITGIEISSYGKDIGAHASIAAVTREIGAAAPGARIRLGSLDPGILDEGIIREFREIPNLCGHFHLSLQSGCDETLRRMGRRYSTDKISSAISMLRDSFPGCGITADLITGFPGETEEEFEITMGFIYKAAFSDMHIFPYSSRPGTKAADMPGHIDKNIKVERARAAAAAAGEMAGKFRQSQIGKTADVLFEKIRDGFHIGYTGSYIEAAVKNGGPKNSISRVLLTAYKNGVVYGEAIPPM